MTAKKRSWNEEDLRKAAQESFSLRSVIKKIGLVPAGGNYEQVKWEIKRLNIDISHFTGMGWNKGKRYKLPNTRIPTKQMLVKDSRYQSHKLKNRLFEDGMKQKKCELCGWCQMSKDGRIPVELDHINGDRYDNRISNIRILCPNCHSLQPTHRGRNKKTGLIRNNKNG